MKKRISNFLILSLSSLLASGAFFVPCLAHAQEPTTHLERVFFDIWNRNLWENSVSVSGPGSTLEATTHVRSGLEEIIDRYNISSISDVACGDFTWMRQVNLKDVKYIGMDIVPNLVEELKEKWQDEDNKMSFIQGDMTTSDIPKSDLVIARDVLGHLSFEHGLQALRNIKKSGAKYFLSTTFIGGRSNRDIWDGDWRPVNLSDWPYGLGAPDHIIVEHCTAGNGSVADKSLGLWSTDKLPD